MGASAVGAGPEPVQVVDGPMDRLLVAGDGVGAEHHGVTGVQRDHRMLGAGNAAERGERFALGAGAEDAQLRVREPLGLARRHQGARPGLQVAELLGDAHVVEHRAAHHQAASPGLLRGPDHLLQARDVGAEGGDQDPPRGSLHDRMDARPHRPLTRGHALDLGVGAVAEQQQHALVAEPGQPGQVGRLAVHRGLVHLEVAAVDDHPQRGVQSQGAGVGDRMGGVDPLHRDAAKSDRITGAHGVQPGGLDQPVLAQLVAQDPRVSAVP